VSYGLRVRRAPASLVKQKTIWALELVGLAHVAERFVTKLSGGQRQRVALARSIAYEPKVILFDEPLSNLDAKLREQMRIELVKLQREVGITSIYVTHDQTEALVMSDRVVVMDKGVIQQIGDPKTIYAQPVNTFVANFIGLANLMEGVLLGRQGELCNVEIPLGAGPAPLRVQAAGGAGATIGQRLILSLRPEDIAIFARQPDQASNGNVFEGNVIDTNFCGHQLDCRVKVGRYEVNIRIDHYEHFARQQKVFLSFRPEHGLCLTQ
jgi:iron(III) transport system ATP-binding protein